MKAKEITVKNWNEVAAYIGYEPAKYIKDRIEDKEAAYLLTARGRNHQFPTDLARIIDSILWRESYSRGHRLLNVKNENEAWEYWNELRSRKQYPEEKPEITEYYFEVDKDPTTVDDVPPGGIFSILFAGETESRIYIKATLINEGEYPTAFRIKSNSKNFILTEFTKGAQIYKYYGPIDISEIEDYGD